MVANAYGLDVAAPGGVAVCHVAFPGALAALDDAVADFLELYGAAWDVGLAGRDFGGWRLALAGTLIRRRAHTP